jgi:hypothetical protein
MSQILPLLLVTKRYLEEGDGAVKGQTLKTIFLSCTILFWKVIIHC